MRVRTVRFGVAVLVWLAVGCGGRSRAVRFVVPTGHAGPLAIHVDERHAAVFDGPAQDEVHWGASGLLCVRDASVLHEWHSSIVVDEANVPIGDFHALGSSRMSRLPGFVLWYFVGSRQDADWFSSATGAQETWLRERGAPIESIRVR